MEEGEYGRYGVGAMVTREEGEDVSEDEAMKRRREVGVGRVMIQCTELHYIPQYHTVVHRMTLNQTMHSKDMVYGCGEHK